MIPFEEFLAKLTPEERETARIDSQKLTDEIDFLSNLRKSKGITQKQLAATLGVTQGNISRIERGMGLVSTLKFYIEGLGGTIELIAAFPDGTETRIKVGD